MADTARQDIWGARGDSETSDGVVCSSGRRKELNPTCEERAAWTGSSRVRQERFQAAWYESELFGRSSGYYETCMRCSFGCLMCWGS